MVKLIKHLCIGHKQPDFVPSGDYLMLSPHALGMSNEIVIADDRFGHDFDGASLAEYSQLFGVAELLKAGDIEAQALFLFQYRKFISPLMGGYDSVASWVKVLTPKMGADFFPVQAHFADIQNDLIVGSIFDFGESISSNYSRVHVNEDLVTFAAACAQSNCVEPSDIKALATMRGIIPSPALCYVSVEVFLDLMEVLRQVAMIYMAHYHSRREGYQSRSVGYMLERLHSVLICQKIMRGELVDVGVWNRYVINSEIN